MNLDFVCHTQRDRAHLLFCFGQVNPVWFVALFSAQGD